MTHRAHRTKPHQTFLTPLQKHMLYDIIDETENQNGFNNNNNYEAIYPLTPLSSPYFLFLSNILSLQMCNKGKILRQGNACLLIWQKIQQRVIQSALHKQLYNNLKRR